MIIVFYRGQVISSVIFLVCTFVVLMNKILAGAPLLLLLKLVERHLSRSSTFYKHGKDFICLFCYLGYIIVNTHTERDILKTIAICQFICGDHLDTLTIIKGHK